jgi:hypothetical protein
VLLTGCQRTPDTVAVDERLAQLPKFDAHPFTAESRADDRLTLRTSVVPRTNERATDSDYNDIALIVWETYRPRFDALEISAKGAPTSAKFTRADLVVKFGEPVHTMKPEDYPSSTDLALLYGTDFAGLIVLGLLVLAVGVYLFMNRRKKS